MRVVTAPYDAGHRGVRGGAGPEALVEGGLFDRLSWDGLEARLRVVELGGSSRHEVASAFELAGLISEGVRSSLNAGAFPLVLSGNCNGCVGTLGGLGGKDPGILWLDGHADFHTPETTTSGFTDCMGLSIAVGHCWRGMAARVPGFEPVPEANAVLVGAREIEPGERERLLASGGRRGRSEDGTSRRVGRRPGRAERARAGSVPPYRSRRAGSRHGRQGQRVRASGRANGRGGRVSYPAGAGAR